MESNSELLESAVASKWRPTNHLTRAEREELKALSKAVFGSTSRWQKLVDKGTIVLATRSATEFLTQEDGSLKKANKEIPLLNAQGRQYSVHKRYTAEEIKERMLVLQVQLKEFQKTMAETNANSEQAIKASGNAL